MKTVWRFLTKFAKLIVCTLHCFDRVLFKGHLSLAAPRELEYFVDCVLKVRRSYFMKTMAPQFSDRLVEHARGWARKAGRTYQYRTGQFRKDEWAQNLIRDQGIVGDIEQMAGHRTGCRREGVERVDALGDLGHATMTVAEHPLDPAGIGQSTPHHPRDLFGNRARLRHRWRAGIEVVELHVVAE